MTGVQNLNRVLAVARGMQSRDGWAKEDWDDLSPYAQERWLSRARYALIAVDTYDGANTTTAVSEISLPEDAFFANGLLCDEDSDDG